MPSPPSGPGATVTFLVSCIAWSPSSPTRERRWGLLALAQYQAGRQAEALGTLKRARTTLVNEFGLDSGPQLAELEEAILRQDPALVAEGTLPVADASCPYLGLVAYDIGDATAYFGREADVTACLRRLDAAGVLAVVGPVRLWQVLAAPRRRCRGLGAGRHAVQIVTPGAHPEDVLAAWHQRGRGCVRGRPVRGGPRPGRDSVEREAFFAGAGRLRRPRAARHLAARRPPRRARRPPSVRSPGRERVCTCSGAHDPDAVAQCHRGPGRAGGAAAWSRVWSTCSCARPRDHPGRCRCSRTCCARRGGAGRGTP